MIEQSIERPHWRSGSRWPAPAEAMPVVGTHWSQPVDDYATPADGRSSWAAAASGSAEDPPLVASGPASPGGVGWLTAAHTSNQADDGSRATRPTVPDPDTVAAAARVARAIVAELDDPECELTASAAMQNRLQGVTVALDAVVETSKARACGRDGS